MALKYTLLGLIDIAPMSGYDIVKAFDYSSLFYWHATHTQVYRTLKELEKDGLIAGKVVHQTDNPSKKVFSITCAGRVAMDRWVREEPELPGFKHAFLIKFTYAADMGDDELLNQLDTYEQKLKEKLALLTSEEKSGFLMMARSPRERLLWEMTNENGTMYYRNEIAWAEKAKAAITEGKR
mgnify:FL=1